VLELAIKIDSNVFECTSSVRAAKMGMRSGFNDAMIPGEDDTSCQVGEVEVSCVASMM